MATKKTERGEIKRFGGKPQPNSGRGNQKGDAKRGPYLVDVKEYVSSYGLSRSNWAKVSTDASRHGLQPALMVALGEGSETVRLWVTGERMFLEMLEAWEEKYAE